MTTICSRERARFLRLAAITFFSAILISANGAPASAQRPTSSPPSPQDAARAESLAAPPFRLERVAGGGGAELLTVWGYVSGVEDGQRQSSELPLVSVLRDTLGDEIAENDRLRYVWMLTYTRPNLIQRAAAAVPFLYGRVGGKKGADKDRPPPPLLDLAAADREVWQRLFLSALQSLLIEDPWLRASARSYRRNVSDYRKAHVIRALAILSLYESQAGAVPAFTHAEMTEIQARLMLTEQAFGGLLDDIHLRDYYEGRKGEMRDVRGHNWELLRQRAEAGGLYFEPLMMPDGTATHAVLWAARSDLGPNRFRKFDSRFLNIKSPWQDSRLSRWKGYTEIRHFDPDHRPAAAGTPGARPVELVPLAVYGLDHPKIPALLVDFRDTLNPKKREASRRVVTDVARNLLGLSRFGDLHYLLGRAVFDFVTSRRGADINQPSRLRTYSQLKLLLSVGEDINPAFRAEINGRLEHVSLNPAENDLAAERRIALDQYRALREYAARPGGLPARLDRDRREEMVGHAHGAAAGIAFRAANILSVGLYTHREAASRQGLSRLDLERRLAFHTRFLRQVARSGPAPEVTWNMDDVHRSLRFVARHGASADKDAARAAGRIFNQTQDAMTKELCLAGLGSMPSRAARNELLRIRQDESVAERWRTLSAEYLLEAAGAVRNPRPGSPTTAAAAAKPVTTNPVGQ